VSVSGHFAQHLDHFYRSNLAWRVIPRNYLLFACHATNASAQLTQDARFVNYWYMGGREKKLAAASSTPPEQAGEATESKVLEAVNAARKEAKVAEQATK
jgi:mitochondrial pyruvate carrier 1